MYGLKLISGSQALISRHLQSERANWRILPVTSKEEKKMVLVSEQLTGYDGWKL